MPVTYRPATEVAAVADGLIEDVHTHLADVEVRYWFRSESATRGGRDVWGDAKKMTGLTAAMIRAAEDEDALPGEDGGDMLSDPFFVLVLAEDIWRLIEQPARKALVDHLLSRCRVEGSEEGTRLTIAQPDVAEFAAVIARNGMWTDDIKRLIGAAYKSHPTLFDPETVEALTVATGVSTDPAAASVKLLPTDGRWEGRCSVCDEFFSDDVRAQAEAAVTEHLEMHNTQAEVAEALASGEVEDEGDEGAFGAAFDDKIAELAHVETERHLQVAR